MCERVQKEFSWFCWIIMSDENNKCDNLIKSRLIKFNVSVQPGRGLEIIL